MSHFFIVNVKVLVLIKWSHTPPPPPKYLKAGSNLFQARVFWVFVLTFSTNQTSLK